MTLDLPTLYSVAALALIVAGLVQIVPSLVERRVTPTTYWAIGHLMMGVGNVVVLARGVLPVGLIGVVPSVMHIVAYALILHGVRSIGGPGRRLSPLLIFAGVATIPIIALCDLPWFEIRVGYMNTLRGTGDLAVAIVAVRLARREGLYSAWIMATLFGASVPLFLGRAVMAFSGRLGHELLGPQDGPAVWLAAGAIALVIFRGFSLPQIFAELDRRALADQAYRDALTGACNRLWLDGLRRRLRGPVALMMVDLDRFKALNDVAGHAIGDATLRIFADVAQAVLGTRGTLVRMGGDEFLCVMPAADAATADATADVIEARFAIAVRGVVPDSLCPTVSIGVIAGDDASGFDALLVEADRAMYEVKRTRGPRDRRADDRPMAELRAA